MGRRDSDIEQAIERAVLEAMLQANLDAAIDELRTGRKLTLNGVTEEDTDPRPPLPVPFAAPRTTRRRGAP